MHYLDFQSFLEHFNFNYKNLKTWNTFSTPKTPIIDRTAYGPQHTRNTVTMVRTWVKVLNHLQHSLLSFHGYFSFTISSHFINGFFSALTSHMYFRPVESRYTVTSWSTSLRSWSSSSLNASSGFRLGIACCTYPSTASPGNMLFWQVKKARSWSSTSAWQWLHLPGGSVWPAPSLATRSINHNFVTHISLH